MSDTTNIKNVKENAPQADPLVVRIGIRLSTRLNNRPIGIVDGRGEAKWAPFVTLPGDMVYYPPSDRRRCRRYY
jgi:hypothetical protein